MIDRIDKDMTARVFIKDGKDEIDLGVAHLEITGDFILRTKRIKLKKLRLIAKEGEVIYERR